MKKRPSTLVWIAGLSMAGVVSADIIYVPEDYATIQEAINAAVNGDEIVVAPGTYVENIDFVGKGILVRSTFPRDPDVVAATRIDGNGIGQTVTFESDEGPDSVLDGLTVANGQTGILCFNSSPTIRNCTITDNSATWRGGGIYCLGRSSEPVINRCLITGNSALGSGGGICSDGFSNVLISNCEITHNSAGGLGDGSGGGGGGIAASDGGQVTIAQCTIADNSTVRAGGGVFLGWEHPGEPAHDVRATEGFVFMTINDSHIARNSAAHGGGIYARLASTIISNCKIFDNVATDTGGGMKFDECLPNATVSNCIISGNSAIVRGGGVFSSAISSTYLLNCMILNNSAEHGGGVTCTFYGGLFTGNCLVFGNTAVYNGGGASSHRFGFVEMSNSIFWNNSAPDGAEISVTRESTATVAYCDVEEGQAGTYVEDGSILTWGEGNIDADPLFVSGPLGEFYLSQIASGQPFDSPCVDAGSTLAENLELDIRTTRTDQVPDSGLVDMGYHYPLAIHPEGLEIIRGQVVAGDLEDLFESDDSRLVVQPGLTLDPDEPPVWLILTGTAPVGSPATIGFTLESRVDTPGVTQEIALFNYLTEEFQEIDSRIASFNEDGVVEIILDSDPSHFIHPDTLEIKAQLTWRPGPLVLQYPWNVGIDQAVWTVVP